MSLESLNLDPVRLYKSFQSGFGRRPETGVKPVDTAPEYLPRTPMHVTRVLGKLCFSCRSVNPLNDKYCCECGAPLFRPDITQMLRPGHPFKDGAS